MPIVESLESGEKSITSVKEVIGAEKTGYRWVILTCLWLVNFLYNGFHAGVTASLLPEIGEELGLTHTQIGTAWGSMPFGLMLFSVVGGILADRFGVKRVIAPALIGGAIFCVARTLLPSFWGLTATMLFMGVSQAFIIPNFFKSIGQWFDSAELGTAIGLFVVAYNVGSALGVMLGASVLSPALGGWREVMWLMGGIIIVLAAMWIILVKERHSAKAMEEVPLPQPGFLEGLRKVLRIRDLWLLAIIEACIIGGSIAWLGMAPDILVSKGMSAGTAGLFISSYMWVSIPSSIIGAYASDRCGMRKLFMWPFMMLFGIALMLQGFIMGAPLVCAIVLAGIGHAVAIAPLRAVILETEGVGRNLSGSAMGVVFTINRFGALVWPILMGALIDYTGLYWPPLLLLGLMGFISTGLALSIKETGMKRRLQAL